MTFKNLYKTLIVLLLLLLISCIALDCYYTNKRNNEIKQTIENILNTQANASIIFPQSLLVSTKDSLVKVHFDSLRVQIIDKLVTKYLNSKETGDTIAFIDIDYATFSLKEKTTINKADLERLRNHIAYLSNTVNKAIENCKRDYDNQLSSLNRWLSIWIGIVAILGVFIPIVINYKTSEDIDKMKGELSKIEAIIKDINEVLTDENKNAIINAKAVLTNDNKAAINTAKDVLTDENISSINSMPTLIENFNELKSAFNLYKAIDKTFDIDNEILSLDGYEKFIENLRGRLENISRTMNDFHPYIIDNNNEIWRYFNQLKTQLLVLSIKAAKHRNELQPISNFNQTLGLTLQNKVLTQEHLVTIKQSLDILIDQLKTRE